MNSVCGWVWQIGVTNGCGMYYLYFFFCNVSHVDQPPRLNEHILRRIGGDELSWGTTLPKSLNGQENIKILYRYYICSKPVKHIAACASDDNISHDGNRYWLLTDVRD